MANTKKADPSAVFSDSISIFTKSATKAFNEFQNQVRGDTARAEADARQARNERDEALKALQESKKESQQFKDENLELKARLKEAELTISHHIENYALLQRETNQWRDQAKNWQEHFLRVEQERCSLASRMDELVTERLIIPPVTPKLPTAKPTALSTIHSNPPRPPTYHSAAPASSTRDANSARSLIPSRSSRSTGKSAKRRVPSQSELPPYTEVAQTPQTTKASASTTDSVNRSTRKTAAASRTKKVASPPPAPVPVRTSKEPSEPQQILIRRVRAVVEVKQEEESDEGLGEPVPPESPEEPALTPRRSHKARRARQIIDDDDYIPDDASQLGTNEDADDDELMIGAGDDLSFDISSSSSTRPFVSQMSPNKKRKLNTSTSSKPKARRKM